MTALDGDTSELYELLRNEHKQLIAVHELESAYSNCRERLADHLKSISLWDRILVIRNSSGKRRSRVKELQLEEAILSRELQSKKAELEPISKEVRHALALKLARVSGNYKMGLKLQEVEGNAFDQLVQLETSLKGLVSTIQNDADGIVSRKDDDSEDNEKSQRPLGLELDDLLESIDDFNTRSRNHNAATSSNHYRGIQLPQLDVEDLISARSRLRSPTNDKADLAFAKALGELETLKSVQFRKAKLEIEHATEQTTRILDGLLTKHWYETRLQLKVGVSEHSG